MPVGAVNMMAFIDSKSHVVKRSRVSISSHSGVARHTVPSPWMAVLVPERYNRDLYSIVMVPLSHSLGRQQILSGIPDELEGFPRNTSVQG